MSDSTVEWSPYAQGDLEDIIEYLAAEAPINAAKVLDHLESVAEALSTFPHRGRKVPELAWQGLTGYLQVAATPWRVVYRVAGRRVLIVAVVDGRRDLEDVLLARLLSS